MNAQDLAERIGKITKSPLGTVNGRVRALRAGGMVTAGGRGRYGVAEMTSGDAATLLLACVAGHRYGTDPAANVRRVRAIPFRDKSVIVNNFADALAFTRAGSFGAALDALIDDMRSGVWERFRLAFPDPRTVGVRIDFENLDAGILLMGNLFEGGSGDWFYRKGPPHRQQIWRHTMLDGIVFQQLALALGPPD